MNVLLKVAVAFLVSLWLIAFVACVSLLGFNNAKRYGAANGTIIKVHGVRK